MSWAHPSVSRGRRAPNPGSLSRWLGTRRSARLRRRRSVPGASRLAASLPLQVAVWPAVRPGSRQPWTTSWRRWRVARLARRPPNPSPGLASSNRGCWLVGRPCKVGAASWLRSRHAALGRRLTLDGSAKAPALPRSRLPSRASLTCRPCSAPHGAQQVPKRMASPSCPAPATCSRARGHVRQPVKPGLAHPQPALPPPCLWHPGHASRPRPQVG
mmetsp:Transcript_50278/g.139602  ORF Transcript_50278/g.139602 Transcript_50278/m.139602 type:complete len:215 (-) Transcript_50278:625-1269(-)